LVRLLRSPFGLLSHSDVRKAPKRELFLDGIPKQPDALTHPKLRLLWEQIAERRLRFIEPGFLSALE
jgi:hypothetical protein